ncbi:MAG: arsenosugar biosynthesis radical SAM protein ArsS [Gammaproteobacteria bacterium]|nr:arsenosugar biosynthesis radical SAM protein ArsS [Gammaproteobacteria bacterium]
MNQPLRKIPVNPFAICLDRNDLTLTRAPLQALQINVGKLCNQACHHCHVDAGPKRTEIMIWETMARILDWSTRHHIHEADITGGAPEINPHFRRFVDGFLAQGCHVTARCNLTVLLEPGQEDLAAWYATRGVRLVCSLPCYTRANVEAQRGRGVFDKSIEALKRLNAVGYGRESRLPLDLVYNPGGAFLPGPQAKLEADYRERLRADRGIEFTHLRTLTNLPINRFAHWLEREGKYDAYLQLLEERFNPETVPGLMCRYLLSVDWRGRVYDCDFNQMLELPLAGRVPRHLWDIEVRKLAGKPIATGSHCLGCTAGSGSSCGGALT